MPGSRVRRSPAPTRFRRSEPAPVSVLYLFCQWTVGQGHDTVLRFGGTKNSADIVGRTELGTRPLKDRPLVQHLAMKGWGFLPTYNGTQGDGKLTASQGVKDADQAADLMQKRGFATGQLVYLDIE